MRHVPCASDHSANGANRIDENAVSDQISEVLRTPGSICLAHRFQVAWIAAEPSTSARMNGVTGAANRHRAVAPAGDPGA